MMRHKPNWNCPSPAHSFWFYTARLASTILPATHKNWELMPGVKAKTWGY